jgi:carboxylesterase
VHPREDDRANIANSFWLQRNLAGTVSMVVLNDSYHVVTMDRQRQLVADRTVAFVESIVHEREGGAATTVEALRRVRQAPGCAA